MCSSKLLSTWRCGAALFLLTLLSVKQSIRAQLEHPAAQKCTPHESHDVPSIPCAEGFSCVSVLTDSLYQPTIYGCVPHQTACSFNKSKTESETKSETETDEINHGCPRVFASRSPSVAVLSNEPFWNSVLVSPSCELRNDGSSKSLWPACWYKFPTVNSSEECSHGFSSSSHGTNGSQVCDIRPQQCMVQARECNSNGICIPQENESSECVCARGWTTYEGSLCKAANLANENRDFLPFSSHRESITSRNGDAAMHMPHGQQEKRSLTTRSLTGTAAVSINSELSSSERAEEQGTSTVGSPLIIIACAVAGLFVVYIVVLFVRKYMEKRTLDAQYRQLQQEDRDFDSIETNYAAI